MWVVSGKDLSMAEGDFGLELPVTIHNATFDVNDEISLTVKTAPNGDVLLEKTSSDIVDNTVKFTITEQETALLPVGTYVYALDWYQNGEFMCNVIPFAIFKVVDKA